MSKKIRTYILVIFVILFISGTAYASIYASGHKINLSWPLRLNRLLIKTGMVIISSSPGGATVYLNNQPQTNFSLNPWTKKYLHSSDKINNISPGSYDLSLELDNYWPFRKNIKVYPGQTTIIENVNLFRADTPLLIAETTNRVLSLSPSQKYLYIAGTNQIINLKNGSNLLLPSNSLSNSQWFKNIDYLLTNGIVFDPNKNSTFDYQKSVGTSTTKWQSSEQENILFYLYNQSLSSLNLDNRASSLILSGEDYIDYEIHDNFIFLIIKQENKLILKKYNRNENRFILEKNLPIVGDYRFVDDNPKYITLYDQANKTLYLLPSDTLNGITVREVISWQWTSENTIVYNNDWEIHSLDVSRGKDTLLTRISEKIGQLAWHQDNKFLLFTTENSLQTFDLQTENITKIFQADIVDSPTLNIKDNILYFWAKIKERTGVYSLRLQ